MLDLALCRRLKEAGFPQLIDDGPDYPWTCTGDGGVWELRTDRSGQHTWEESEFHAPVGPCRDGEVCWSSQNKQGELFYCPTISELLENLPKDKTLKLIFSPQQTNDRFTWLAEYDVTFNSIGAGATPEQAIADLWLALHPVKS